MSSCERAKVERKPIEWSDIKHAPGVEETTAEVRKQWKSPDAFMICIPNEAKSMHTFSVLLPLNVLSLYFYVFFFFARSLIQPFSFAQYFYYGYPYQIIFVESKLESESPPPLSLCLHISHHASHRPPMPSICAAAVDSVRMYDIYVALLGRAFVLNRRLISVLLICFQFVIILYEYK